MRYSRLSCGCGWSLPKIGLGLGRCGHSSTIGHAPLQCCLPLSSSSGPSGEYLVVRLVARLLASPANQNVEMFNQ